MTNQQPLPIVDTFGRTHNNLRISVTDRCNIRCFYCMPETAEFLPQNQVLSFEEIVRFVDIVSRLGVNKIRLTGGEPLVRRNLTTLIEMLTNISGINDIALTTNGILLADHAQALRDAGLHRLNVSLDTLDESIFKKITRRKGLDRVLEGIQIAQDVGFQQIRLNAISMRGLTETQIIPLARFARKQDLNLRFIEFMPLDADENWSGGAVLSGAEVKQIIEKNVGSLEQDRNTNPSQPARDFRYDDGGGSVGFINSVTEPFCSACDRMRLTAEGKLRNCLFSETEWDIRELLRSDASEHDIEDRIRECVAAKKAEHGTDTGTFFRPVKAMYQIGG